MRSILKCTLDHPDFPFVDIHSTTNRAKAFPVYNIIEQKDGVVKLEMAVAGYDKSQIKVEREGNTLIVEGTKQEKTDEDGAYRYHGISSASFLRTFDLRPLATVDNVQLKDGILTVIISVPKSLGTDKTTFEIK